jgi:penicillin-insensitive murein endopeptidase
MRSTALGALCAAGLTCSAAVLVEGHGAQALTATPRPSDRALAAFDGPRSSLALEPSLLQPSADASARISPLLLSDEELALLIRYDPELLGSMSFGLPNRGFLVNAVQMPPSELWRVAQPDHAWGTEETIHSIARAVEKVHEEFAEAPPLYIGHISSQRGGYLRPHRSHQSGRDADIGYYYLDGAKWYARATAANLDPARTWVLVKALVDGGDVDFVFMDRSIQLLLREYAEIIGEDAAWLAALFESNTRDRTAIIRHTWGHTTHLHVRFRNPEAEAAAKRAQPFSKQLLALR